MNINFLIPLFSALFYAIVIVILLVSGLNKIKRVFIIYLTATMLWSLSAFFVHANFFPDRTLFIHQFLIVFGYLVPLAFFYFAAVFTNRSVRLLIILSAILFVTLVILNFTGLLLLESAIVDKQLIFSTSTLFLAGLLLTFTFLGIGVTFLVQKYRTTVDPLERNRILYLLTGVIINLAFVCTLFFEATAKYPLDHIGNVIFAILIAYSISKYELFNIKIVARRIAAYFILIVPLAGVYIGLLLLGELLFPNQPIFALLISATVLAIVIALVGRALWTYIPHVVDRFFYRNTYKQRRDLINLGNKLGGVINLRQLTDEILPVLCNVMNVDKAQLLLRDVGTGDYNTQFVYPEDDSNEGSLTLHSDNPVVVWLERKNRPLESRQIFNLPEFKGMWQEEKNQIKKSNLGLISPIKNRGELIGIFVLGKKRKGIHTQEDFEMMMTVSSQAGVIIENGQQYSQALLKANTDGLTQLYNHRHFHERLEQEIGRSSRFGTVFSLIMMDIDLFKIYNDNYGHLAGDEILRKIGDYIRSSIRGIDIAARYGGEEFVIILPETKLTDAHIVAERIRKLIESKTSQKSMPVTLSIGIASWPVDGVMKEELITKADKALYLAKQNGRNCTCLSSDINKHDLTGEYDESGKALSIIYALAATVDAKDHYTYGHSRKVSEYAVSIAESLKLPQDKIAVVRAAGLLHDIGNIGIPDSILNKKEPLSPEEWEPIKSHPQLGVAIIRNISGLSECLPAILHHHEHFDGSGYPNGLKGANIPHEARILSVADAYEAMTSPRAYRKQLTQEQAMAELKQCAGIQFDPDIVEVFCKVLEKSHALRH